MTQNSAADVATIGLVVGGLTLAICPLIGAYAGVCAAKSQLRHLRADMWPHPNHQTRSPIAADARLAS
jgi:hypothetical protein